MPSIPFSSQTIGAFKPRHPNAIIMWGPSWLTLAIFSSSCFWGPLRLITAFSAGTHHNQNYHSSSSSSSSSSLSSPFTSSHPYFLPGAVAAATTHADALRHGGRHHVAYSAYRLRHHKRRRHRHHRLQQDAPHLTPHLASIPDLTPVVDVVLRDEEARAASGFPSSSAAQSRASFETLFTPWTEWTACSRTCGGGVRSRTRRCFLVDVDPKACRQPEGGWEQVARDDVVWKEEDGLLTQHEICNAGKCFDALADFRADQCSKYNNKTVLNKVGLVWGIVWE